jgi:hypothetical protein
VEARRPIGLARRLPAYTGADDVRDVGIPHLITTRKVLPERGRATIG